MSTPGFHSRSQRSTNFGWPNVWSQQRSNKVMLCLLVSALTPHLKCACSLLFNTTSSPFLCFWLAILLFKAAPQVLSTVPKSKPPWGYAGPQGENQCVRGVTLLLAVIPLEGMGPDLLIPCSQGFSRTWPPWRRTDCTGNTNVHSSAVQNC